MQISKDHFENCKKRNHSKGKLIPLKLIRDI